MYLICIVNTTNCISSVQPQTYFCVIVFVIRRLLLLCSSIGRLLRLCLSIINLLLLCLSSFKSLAFVLEQL